MAMTEQPLARQFPNGDEKSSPPRRHPAPIRPNFRPLLPKPCTHQPLQPNAIHIHTRSSISIRKRMQPSAKSDIQKRRRPETTRQTSRSIETVPTKHSVVAIPSLQKPQAVQLTPPASVSEQPTSVSTASIFGVRSGSPENAVSPVPVVNENLATRDSEDSSFAFQPENYENQLASPAQSVNSLGNGIIDSIGISIENDPFYRSDITSLDKMTPPYSQKSFPDSNEFDALSDFYFEKNGQPDGQTEDDSTKEEFFGSGHPATDDSDMSMMEFLTTYV